MATPSFMTRGLLRCFLPIKCPAKDASPPQISPLYDRERTDRDGGADRLSFVRSWNSCETCDRQKCRGTPLLLISSPRLDSAMVIKFAHKLHAV